MEKLLCLRAPDPPPAAVDFAASFKVPADYQGTRRQLAEMASASSPACSGCHAVINPIGYGFEEFDDIGRPRTTDRNLPIDSSGRLPDGTTFASTAELMRTLSASPQVAACTAGHFLSYALGTRLDDADADRCNSRAVAAQAVDASRSLAEFVQAVVRTDAFSTTGGQP
jgi:hypothetical protein